MNTKKVYIKSELQGGKIHVEKLQETFLKYTITFL